MAVKNYFNFDFSGPMQSKDRQVDVLVLKVLFDTKEQ